MLLEDIREAGTFGEVCEALGLDPASTSPRDAIAALQEAMEAIVEREYEKCPLDSRMTPIHVGDIVSELGEVYGIGDDCIMALYIDDGSYTGHAAFPARPYTVLKQDAIDLVREIVTAARMNEPTDAMIARYAGRIEARHV